MDYIEDYKISDDKSLIELDRVYELLSKSYWATKRTKECIEISIKNSICYGVYHENLQIGFARVITDYATTFYIADVIIDENYRGKGLGKNLMEYITGQDMFENMSGILATKDAHGLYEKYGFTRDAEGLMRKRHI